MANTNKASERVSLNDIAKRLGISKGAVSLAMNGSDKISDETKRKVLKTAEKMGYKKNALVSNMMSNIKASRQSDFLETIVLINANKHRDALVRYPIFSKYIDGINAESAKLGYTVYQIWLHEKSMTPEKLRGILESRSIRGGIIIGYGEGNVLPPKFADVWNNFKFVSAGIRTSNPFFDFISADKFLIAHHAMQKVMERGYKKPSMVLDERIDELVEGRFIGGFLRAQLALGENSRVPPFTDVKKAMENPELFFKWLKKYKPDAIFSISSITSEWLASGEIASKIPTGVAVIEFEKKSEKGDWTGLDENYETVGRVAVNKLFNVLNAPVYLRDDDIHTATIVQPKWSDK